jgi:hypothetical protein
VIGVNGTGAELVARVTGQSEFRIVREPGKRKGEKWYCGHMARGLVGGAVAQQPLGASCFRFLEWGTAKILGEHWPLTGALALGFAAGLLLAASPYLRKLFIRGFCALATPFSRDT